MSAKRHSVIFILTAVLGIMAFISCVVTYARYLKQSEGNDGAAVAAFGDLSLQNAVTSLQVQPGVNETISPILNYTASEMETVLFVKLDLRGFKTDDMKTIYSDAEAIGAEMSFVLADELAYAFKDANVLVYYILLHPGDFVSDLHLVKNDTLTVSDTIRRTDLESCPVMSCTFSAKAVQSSGYDSLTAAYQGGGSF